MDAVAKYEALAELSRAVSERSELVRLFQDLRMILRRMVWTEYVMLTTYDASTQEIHLRLIDSDDVHHVPIGQTFPLSQSPAKAVVLTGKPLYFARREDVPPSRMREVLEADGIESTLLLPLVTERGAVGVLGVGQRTPEAFSEEDRAFLELAARPIAVAVENALAHEKLAAERNRLRMVLDLNNAIATELELKPLLTAIARILRPHLEQNYFGLTLWNEEAQALVSTVVDYPDSRGLITEAAGARIPLVGSPVGEAFTSGEVRFYDAAQIEAFGGQTSEKLLNEGFESFAVIPLRTGRAKLGTMNVASRKPGAFAAEAMEMLVAAAGQIAIAVENALAYARISEWNAKLERERIYLAEEIKTEHPFDEIVGQSAALRQVLQQVETVAAADTTVLILGESGTGKELIARAIHDRSERARRTFVKMNCAAIPTGLLESELFGHERGAFTGAIQTKVGRFELADGGTLFLDEIGEVGLEVQPKLLRVLQEKEFERLGSAKTLRGDVRLVAATNRDLKAMVEAKQFRLDLFYRLNIFPIEVPALRERASDVPLLVRHFVREYARKLGRTITTIPSEAMEAMERYSWPGNIRELQNLIERSVLLSHDETLRIRVEELRDVAPVAGGAKSLDDVEREAILAALERSAGRVGGPKGAAVELGLKRTTLISRMEKLGIARAKL